jgi:hypothetical protein
MVCDNNSSASWPSKSGGHSEEYVMKLKVLSLSLLLALLPVSARAQTIPRPSTGNIAPHQPPQPIPLPRLYLEFFNADARLQQVDREHPEVPADKGFHHRLRAQVGLSEANWVKVGSASARMEALYRSLVAQVKTIVQADRATCRATPQACTSGPPGLAQVRQLQAQRDTALTAAIASLEADLGPAATARLHIYLQHDFAGHVHPLHRPAAAPPAAGKAVAR